MNFIDGLGYMVNGDALGSACRKVAWERLEKVWGGEGGIKLHIFLMLFLTKKLWINKGRSLPALALPV